MHTDSECNVIECHFFEKITLDGTISKPEVERIMDITKRHISAADSSNSQKYT